MVNYRLLTKKVEAFWKKKQQEHKLWANMEIEEDEDLIEYLERNKANDLAADLRAKAAKARENLTRPQQSNAQG